MTARLEMVNVHKRFGATLALRGVSLSVAGGEVHALVGENGAGKSTLMKVLAGAIRPDAGAMRLDGSGYAPGDPAAGRRAGVAMVYQELSLAPHLTVAQNILLGQEPARWPWLDRGAMRARATAALRELGHDDIDPDAPVRSLPLAQRQLVEIARGVALNPGVLVLDEPTSSLSAADTQRLFELIHRLKQRGLAVVYISHFLEEVRAVSDRFTVLRDGQTVGGGVIADTPTPRIIALMVGREVSDLYPRRPRKPGEAALSLRGVTGATKPRGVDLDLHRGEVLGVAGLVGAGRTELLRAIFALDRVVSGAVSVGVYVGPASPARRWAQGVGLVSEDRKSEGLALNLSVADNLTLPRLSGLTSGGQRCAMSRPWIDKLSVRCASPAQRVGDLSGGNQQKVALARLLHARSAVLLLDEPTRGIDVGSKAQIYQLIDERAAEGCAVLLVSSYLPELLGVCDRVAVMHRGRLSPPIPVTETDEHQLMRTATGAAA